MRAVVIIGLSILLAGGYIWMTFSAQQGRSTDPASDTHRLTSSTGSSPQNTSLPQERWDVNRLAQPSKQTPPLSPMAYALANPEGSPQADVKALLDIFAYTTLEDSGQIPTGSNREITTALTTPNVYGIAYLPKVHPAISKQGRIIDRWNTPYFFHALSSEKMEVRSAGPDKLLFTEDDIVLPEKEETPKRPKDYVQVIDLGL